ncbi:MAG: hypothetical protein JWM86_213 [Thermoleophilia bacterium]|nr:hypothetical protein [Thermoleophilia bacterium]
MHVGMSHRPRRSRVLRTHRGRTVRALAGVSLLAASIACTLPAGPAGGATSSTVVTADIPTATSLTDLCTTTPATSFGIVQPGTPATTSTGAPCRFQFSSSNGTAQLRVRQADQTGTAMADDTLDVEESQYDERPQRSISIEPGVPATAWTVDGWGGALRTTNSGGSWTALADPSAVNGGNPCNSIDVVSATTAWAGCDNGRVVRTTTTGSSWTQVGSVGPTITSISAISATAAVIATSDGRFMYTTNTGGNWTAGTGVPGGTDYATSVDMLDASNGYATINPGGHVLRTINGGVSWTELTSSGSSGSCGNVDAVTATVAWIGCDGWAMKTTNGTSLTAVANLPTDVNAIRSMAATSASVATAFGETGSIYRTIDGGASWIDETAVTLTDLNSAALSGTRLYAVGSGDLVVTSNDTADTWSVARTGGQVTLTGVDMVTGLVGWAVGERGDVQRTSDGGVNWSYQSSGISTHLRDVAALSTTTAVIVGNGGVILRTTNSGASFTPVTSGTTANLLSISASADGSLLLAAGTNGTAIRSSNGGVTWFSARTAASGSEELHDALVLGNGHMLLAGSSRMLERSIDGGRTWTDITITAAPVWESIRTVAASSDASSIFVSTDQYGTGYRSLDGGTSWTSLPMLGVSGQRGTSMQYQGSGVVTALQRGFLLGSGDSFTNVEESSQTWQHLYAYDAIDATRGVAVGGGGNIYYVLPGTSISDYAAGGTWGSAAATTSMFGGCLQAIGGSAVADWTVDATNVAGTCQALDTDPWRPVPTTPSVVAHTTVNSAAGSVDFVWGFRPAANTPPGRYRAGVLVEVIGT